MDGAPILTGYTHSFHAKLAKWGQSPEYAIWPVMPLGDSLSLAGFSGDGKTTLLTHLGGMIMGGRCEGDLKVSEKGSVVFLLPEAAPVFFNGVLGAAQAYGLSRNDVEDRCIPLFRPDMKDWPAIDKPGYVEQVVALIEKENKERPFKVRAIFTDSTYFRVAGSDSESSVANPVMEHQAAIAQEMMDRGAGVAMVNVLHTTRGGKDADLRGSQVWHDRSAVYVKLKKVGLNGRHLTGTDRTPIKHRYWKAFEEMGLSYTYREVNGLPTLYGFKFGKLNTDDIQPPDSSDMEPVAAVRDDAIGSLAHHHYCETGQTIVSLSKLWDDARAFGWTGSNGKKLHSTVRGRIIEQMGRLGWTCEDDTFIR